MGVWLHGCLFRRVSSDYRFYCVFSLLSGPDDGLGLRFLGCGVISD